MAAPAANAASSTEGTSCDHPPRKICAKFTKPPMTADAVVMYAKKSAQAVSAEKTGGSEMRE